MTVKQAIRVCPPGRGSLRGRDDERTIGCLRGSSPSGLFAGCTVSGRTSSLCSVWPWRRWDVGCNTALRPACTGLSGCMPQCPNGGEHDSHRVKQISHRSGTTGHRRAVPVTTSYSTGTTLTRAQLTRAQRGHNAGTSPEYLTAIPEPAHSPAQSS